MKIILVALNSKYIHAPLALWYMKSTLDVCNEVECEIIDSSINEEMDALIAKILQKSPDVICFSVYIWNIEVVEKMIKTIKDICSDIRIVLGGPEVSYDIDVKSNAYKYSDYIIKGEGEFALREYICESKKTTGFNTIEDLDLLESPYKEEFLEKSENKIVYFEGSRGCPFRCSYCLSGDTKGVRSFSIDRIKNELKKILSYDIKILKFVDRTFNSELLRAKEIIRFLIDNGSDVKIHFEIEAAILDEEIIRILNNSPKGMFLIEAGIQSSNTKTLKEVRRNTDLKKAAVNIAKLIDGDRVHIHLDLIAGLPHEDISSIKKSFEFVYSLKPHELQLGFLKLLKGTEMMNKIDENEYIYSEYPPYEIIRNKYITYLELHILKKMEKVFDRTYNSKLFIRTLKKLGDVYAYHPFDLYMDMMIFFDKHEFFDRNISLKDLTHMIFDFGVSIGIDLKQEIVFDHLSTSRGFFLREELRPEKNIKKRVLDAISEKDGSNAMFDKRDLQTKMKRISFYSFADGDYIFLHDHKDPITGYFRNIKLL